MKKIKSYVKNYLSKSSWLKIISDFLFYSFILLIIIPSTRKSIAEIIIRTTMIRPKLMAETHYQYLNNEDYYLKIEDINGNNFLIGDFKNDVILINFWATWCPSCRAEMSSFQKLFDDYGKQLSFLFITDDKRDKVLKYFSEFNYNLPVYYLRSAPSVNFNINSLPTTYLINRQGEIIAHKKRAADWNSAAFKKELDRLVNKDSDPDQ